MDKRTMLEQLINCYTDGNKTKFAAMIGISPQLVSNWLARKTFDAELLYSKCENVSAGWLLSGDGEMIESSHPMNEDAGEISNVNSKELLRLCKSLISNYQQRDEVMNKLVSMVKEI